MVVAQLLGTNDAVEIRLHQLLNEVDFGEFVYARWLKDVQDGDDVFVMEVAEKFDFSEGPEAEHGMVEGCNPFNGDFTLRWKMNR